MAVPAAAVPVAPPVCEEEESKGRSPGVGKEPKTSRLSNPAKVLNVVNDNCRDNENDDDDDDDDSVVVMMMMVVMVF